VSNEYLSSEYNVRFDFCKETGKVVKEVWRNSAGQLDRPNGEPALQQFSEKTGNLIHAQWYRDGNLDRTGDMPAEIVVSEETNVVIAESYIRAGRGHRDDGKPALIRRAENGKVYEMRYKQHGDLHRSEGGAVERYDPTSGALIEAEFWNYGHFLHIENSNPNIEWNFDI